jgi:hypothetical protein
VRDRNSSFDSITRPTSGSWDSAATTFRWSIIRSTRPCTVTSDASSRLEAASPAATTVAICTMAGASTARTICSFAWNW